ncbi:MAG: tetratricopeptide repeat protein [Moorea sp. SIO4A3]|nr:tetratricopeptide repeat protein [Moorena sp. SIO4A3]
MMKKFLIKFSVSSVITVVGVLGFWIGMPVPIVEQAMSQVSQSEELAEAERLNEQVVQLYQQGKYNEAIPLAEQALGIRKKVLGDNHQDVATSLDNLAQLYWKQGRYSEAEDHYQQSLAIRKEQLGENHPDVATSLNNLGVLYYSQEIYTKAEDYYQQSLAIRKQKLGENHPSVVTSLNNLAALYYSQGRYAKAETFFQQSLSIVKQKLGYKHPNVASSLNNLGKLYYSQGRYKKAEDYYQQSLAIRKQKLGHNHPDVAQSLNNLAEIYYSQGRYVEAENHYQQSLAIRKQKLGDNHLSVAISFNNLALLYNDQGRYKEAEDYYQQSLAIRKQKLGDNHSSVAQSLNNLGKLYYSQGRYKEAEDYYQQSLAIRNQKLVKNHPSVATSLNNLATLYYSQGRYAEAEDYYQQSLDIFKQKLGDNHTSVATSINNLALLYRNQGKYAEAETRYKKSLAILKQQLGDNHPNVAATLNNLASLYQSQGNTTRAIEFLSQGLAVEEYNLSKNLVAGDERQKQDYMMTISETTDGVISLNLQYEPKNLEATRLALKAIFERKGRILDVLSNSLQILRQRIDDPQSQDLLTELFAIRTQHANLIFKKPEDFPSPDVYRKLLTEVENKAKKLADQLGHRSAEFRNLSQPITLEAIQKQIPADAALVELVRYESFGKLRYGAYILYQSGEPQAIDLGEVEAIDKAVEKLRERLRVDNSRTKNIKTAARELDQMVMQPVRQVLGETKTILLSPDAALNLIPFEALVDENNQYLVENYQITYLTSGRDLLRQNPHNNRQSPLVMADPFYYTKIVAVNRSIDHISQLFATKNFGRLEGTAEEAKAIKTTMGLSDNQIKTKGQATENALKQVKNPDFIHIATHGFFLEPSSENSTNVDNPLFRSGLVFAGVEKRQSGGDDGVFTANEATLLNLVGTQLVVLSACDTGIGEISAGEGIYGLRRAFVIAGSESQLISLWKVDDTATKDLMVAYYQGLKARKGRREALSQIQRDWLKGKNGKTYQHPYYWASFIFSGDSTPMEL